MFSLASQYISQRMTLAPTRQTGQPNILGLPFQPSRHLGLKGGLQILRENPKAITTVNYLWNSQPTPPSTTTLATPNVVSFNDKSPFEPDPTPPTKNGLKLWQYIIATGGAVAVEAFGPSYFVYSLRIEKQAFVECRNMDTRAIFSRIWARGGIPEFFKGAVPFAGFSMLARGGFYVGQSELKQRLTEYTSLSPLLITSLAGGGASILQTAFDAAATGTKAITQTGNKSITEVIKSEGLSRLYQGVHANGQRNLGYALIAFPVAEILRERGLNFLLPFGLNSETLNTGTPICAFTSNFLGGFAGSTITAPWDYAQTNLQKVSEKNRDLFKGPGGPMRYIRYAIEKDGFLALFRGNGYRNWQNGLAFGIGFTVYQGIKTYFEESS